MFSNYRRVSRPLPVCWCQHLTDVPLKTNSKVVILQHPNEQKRCLRTAKILELSLCFGRCIVIRGKKFTSFKSPILKDLIEDKQNSNQKTIVLYPGVGSQSLNDLPLGQSYNIVLIDGTWSQSRSIYHNSPVLHSLPKIELNGTHPSNYVIRTQPTDGCLSTVESAALVLSHVENDPTIYEKLTNPLKALCDFQLSFGAVTHQSKEFLIMNGLYNKPLTKRIKQKLFNNEDIKYLIR